MNLNLRGAHIGAAALIAATTALSAPAAADAVVNVKPRTIGYVDQFGAGAMQMRFFSYFKAGADALGWKVNQIDVNGDQSKAAQAAITFMNNGVDAVVTSCTDTAPMQPALRLAKSKNIPILQVGCPMTDPKAWDASFAMDDRTPAKLLGEYIGKQLGSGAEIAVLGDTTIQNGRIRVKAMKEGLGADTAKVVAEQSVDLTNMAASSRQIAQTFVTQFPNLKAMVGIYDYFAAPAGNVVTAGKKGGQISVYSFFADAVNVPYMRTENSPLVAVADGPVEIIDLIAVDQLAAHFEKGAPFDSSAGDKLDLKFEIFTKDKLPPPSDNYLTPYPVKPFLADYVKKWQGEYGAK